MRVSVRTEGGAGCRCYGLIVTGLNILTETPTPSRNRLVFWPILRAPGFGDRGIRGFDSGRHRGSLETLFISIGFLEDIAATTYALS